jgi:MYXO-CTERM domain-containing protein
MRGPLVVDGVKIPLVAIAGELDSFVMVHEFGHLLGLTDLYDESRTYAGLQFSMMGTWGYDRDIPLPDAETRFRLGWANWHQATGTQRLVLLPAELQGQVVRVGQGDSYFLLENRGPGGFDRAFTVRGLAVYQVDRTVRLRGEEGRFQERLLNCVNCDPWHPYIRNVQADGRFELEAKGALRYEDDLFRDGDSLGPDSSAVPRGPSHALDSTNLYSGEPTGIVLRDVVVRADQAIEVTVETAEADPCAEPLCAEGPGCRAVNCEAAGLVWRGCGCGAGGGSQWPAALGLLLLGRAVLGRRHPRRR